MYSRPIYPDNQQVLPSLGHCLFSKVREFHTNFLEVLEYHAGHSTMLVAIAIGWARASQHYEVHPGRGTVKLWNF